MRVCSECKVKKSYWDFNRGRNICKHCLTHRVCSRCDVKKHENDFEKNANGDYFRMCNDCRSICREHSKQTNETVRALPLEEQYVECEKCKGKYHKLNEGKSRHQKRWTCIRKTMAGNPGKKDFYEWLVANEHNPELLKDYRKSIPDAKKYLKLHSKES